ncbi:hypothetical protein OTU49_014363, partial [Cherax quadricarinatus]
AFNVLCHVGIGLIPGPGDRRRPSVDGFPTTDDILTVGSGEGPHDRERPRRPEDRVPDGRPVGPDGRPVGPDGRAVGPDGSSVGPDGRPIGPDGRPIETDGRPVGPDGRPVGPDGRPVGPDVTIPGIHPEEIGSSDGTDVSRPGSSRVPVVDSGQVINPLTGQPEDFDECELMGHMMCKNGRCINTMGSFRCECNVGFRYNEPSHMCV